MKRVSMNIGTHGVETTASEMRRRLARTLSRIPGDQKVFFTLTLHMEDYKPASRDTLRPEIMIHARESMDQNRILLGELARPENE